MTLLLFGAAVGVAAAASATAAAAAASYFCFVFIYSKFSPSIFIYFLFFCFSYIFGYNDLLLCLRLGVAAGCYVCDLYAGPHCLMHVCNMFYDVSFGFY